MAHVNIFYLYLHVYDSTDSKKGFGTVRQSTCPLRGYGTPLYCDVLHINKIIYIFKIFSFPWLLATCNQARSIVFEGKGRGGGETRQNSWQAKKKQKKKRGTFQNLQKPNPRGRGGGGCGVVGLIFTPHFLIP